MKMKSQGYLLFLQDNIRVSMVMSLNYKVKMPGRESWPDWTALKRAL